VYPALQWRVPAASVWSCGIVWSCW
jgi:hypothetical protein